MSDFFGVHAVEVFKKRIVGQAMRLLYAISPSLEGLSLSSMPSSYTMARTVTDW
jgi:hypothetical protein